MRRLAVRPYRAHGPEAPVSSSGGVEIEEGLVPALGGSVGIFTTQVAAGLVAGEHDIIIDAYINVD